MFKKWMRRSEVLKTNIEYYPLRAPQEIRLGHWQLDLHNSAWTQGDIRDLNQELYEDEVVGGWSVVFEGSLRFERREVDSDYFAVFSSDRQINDFKSDWQSRFPEMHGNVVASSLSWAVYFLEGRLERYKGWHYSMGSAAPDEDISSELPEQVKKIIRDNIEEQSWRWLSDLMTIDPHFSHPTYPFRPQSKQTLRSRD